MNNNIILFNTKSIMNSNSNVTAATGRINNTHSRATQQELTAKKGAVAAAVLAAAAAMAAAPAATQQHQYLYI